MKKAFTLIELLVVVGIIAILISVLAVNIFAGGDAARSAKCLTNLKNLANAVSAHVMAANRYPLAGSVEGYRMKTDSSGHLKKVYYEATGWISWYSRQAYVSEPSAHVSSASWLSSAYTQDLDEREYCLTNGAIWKYVGGNREVYTCPAHIRATPAKERPAWSYVMNGYFLYDESKGGRGYADIYGQWGMSVSRLDRRLLFAELQWSEALSGTPPARSSSPGTLYDCTLQYETDPECIGFNHREGKDWVAHVVFADGHVEKLRHPKSSMNESALRDLTEFLCKAKDYSFNGQRYEEMK